jgi:hypothetical protein
LPKEAQFLMMVFILARGTGEPGPFGVVVGDLLVESVTKAIPGSRGYAVQVGMSSASCDIKLIFWRV